MFADPIMQKRKTVMPKRKFRPATAANPPIPQAPPKPNYEIPPTAVRADTPWPGAGKTAGNPIDDRQWLIPKGYPAIQNKESDNDIPSLKEEMKAEKPVISDGPKKEKCGWRPDCPFCKAQEKKDENPPKQTPTRSTNPEANQDQIPTTMGGRDGVT